LIRAVWWLLNTWPHHAQSNASSHTTICSLASDSYARGCEYYLAVLLLLQVLQVLPAAAAAGPARGFKTDIHIAPNAQISASLATQHHPPCSPTYISHRLYFLKKNATHPLVSLHSRASCFRVFLLRITLACPWPRLRPRSQELQQANTGNGALKVLLEGRNRGLCCLIPYNPFYCNKCPCVPLLSLNRKNEKNPRVV
jgi:hypothetical protein